MKPRYAKAIELRRADKTLDERFGVLDDKFKWEWLAYACSHEPRDSLAFARQLVTEHAAGGAA